MPSPALRRRTSLPSCSSRPVCAPQRESTTQNRGAGPRADLPVLTEATACPPCSSTRGTPSHVLDIVAGGRARARPELSTVSPKTDELLRPTSSVPPSSTSDADAPVGPSSHLPLSPTPTVLHQKAPKTPRPRRAAKGKPIEALSPLVPPRKQAPKRAAKRNPPPQSPAVTIPTPKDAPSLSPPVAQPRTAAEPLQSQLDAALARILALEDIVRELQLRVQGCGRPLGVAPLKEWPQLSSAPPAAAANTCEASQRAYLADKERCLARDRELNARDICVSMRVPEVASGEEDVDVVAQEVFTTCLAHLPEAVRSRARRAKVQGKRFGGQVTAVATFPHHSDKTAILRHAPCLRQQGLAIDDNLTLQDSKLRRHLRTKLRAALRASREVPTTEGHFVRRVVVVRMCPVVQRRDVSAVDARWVADAEGATWAQEWALRDWSVGCNSPDIIPLRRRHRGARPGRDSVPGPNLSPLLEAISPTTSGDVGPLSH